MNQNNHQTSWMFILAGIARQLIALGLGLFLGALGETFSWNRQENFLLYLCLLCPLLLGISVALLVGVRNRHPWLNILGAGSLAWIGFYLTFIVIAFHLHPYQSPQSDLSASDPSCSPCFSGDMFVEIFIGEFFPIGFAFVAISALATDWILHMSRHIHRNPDVPGKTFQEFSPSPRTPLAFPLLRNMPFLLQMIVLLLSSLLLDLSITNAGQLFISIVRMPSFSSILLLPLLQGLLLASSTLLCGMLFGSWRGTFVCFLALGGSLLISSLQSHRLGHSFPFVALTGSTFLLSWLPELCATLVVGLIYERRKYANGLASFFTLLLGGTIILGASTVDTSGRFVSLLSLTFFFQSTGLGVLALLGIEVLLQRSIDARKRRREMAT